MHSGSLSFAPANPSGAKIKQSFGSHLAVIASEIETVSVADDGSIAVDVAPGPDMRAARKVHEKYCSRKLAID